MNNPFNFMQNPQNFFNIQPKINPMQFKSFLPQINEQMLSQIVQQARQQGISEKDIEQGLNFIKQL